VLYGKEESEEQRSAETIERERGNTECERKRFAAIVPRTEIDNERTDKEGREKLYGNFTGCTLRNEALPVAGRTIEGGSEVIMTTWPPLMIMGGRGVRRELFCLFMGMCWWGEQAGGMGVAARVFHGEAGQ